MTPEQIVELMEKLGENSTQFGKRFGVTKRTVQDWRQGRRKPNSTAAKMIERLIRRKHP